MYKGRNYYSKLVLKQCYFWLTHHTCLLSRNNTTAHPKPPTSMEKKKKRQMNLPIRIMSFRRKEKKKKKSLTSYTRAPSVRMTAFNIGREFSKRLPFCVWRLDSGCLHFDLWNVTGLSVGSSARWFHPRAGASLWFWRIQDGTVRQHN